MSENIGGGMVAAFTGSMVYPIVKETDTHFIFQARGKLTAILKSDVQLCTAVRVNDQYWKYYGRDKQDVALFRDDAPMWSYHLGDRNIKKFRVSNTFEVEEIVKL